MGCRYFLAAMLILWLATPPASSQLSSSIDDGLSNNVSAKVAINGADNDMVDFGFFIFGTIGDLVWNDSNGNAIYDIGELVLPGVNVSLYDAKNGMRMHSTFTNESGNYTLKVPYGIYRVIVAEDKYAEFEPIYNEYYIKLQEFGEDDKRRWLPKTDNEYVVVIDEYNLTNTSIDFGLQVIE